MLLPNRLHPPNGRLEGGLRIQEVRSGKDGWRSWTAELPRPVGQTLASLEVDEPIGAGHVAVQSLVLAIGNVPEVLPFYRLGASFHLARAGHTFALTCGQ